MIPPPFFLFLFGIQKIPVHKITDYFTVVAVKIGNKNKKIPLKMNEKEDANLDKLGFILLAAKRKAKGEVLCSPIIYINK